jgi:hypothetical protein
MQPLPLDAVPGTANPIVYRERTLTKRHAPACDFSVKSPVSGDVRGKPGRRLTHLARRPVTIEVHAKAKIHATARGGRSVRRGDRR